MKSKYEQYYSRWIELYKSGIGGTTIARNYRCTSKPVYRCLKLAGVHIRSHKLSSQIAGERRAERYVEHRPEYHFFDTIDTEAKAYWLGFIYADGYVGRDDMIRIELKPGDSLHLRKFCNIFNIKLYKRSKFNKGNGRVYDTVYCTAYSRHMWSMLNSKGIYPNRSHEENGTILNHIPNDLMNHFIRGYFDGDGGIRIYNNRGRHHICSIVGSRPLLEFFNTTLTVETAIDAGKILSHSSIYKLCWYSVKNIEMIASYLYMDASIWMERKKLIFTKILHGNLPTTLLNGENPTDMCTYGSTDQQMLPAPGG